MDEARTSRWHRGGEVRHACLLGLTYFLALWVSVAFTRFEGGVAMIWIANGLLCVDLRQGPRGSWWLRTGVCAAASMVATTWLGHGAAAAIPLALVNVGEALGCVILLNRFLPLPRSFESPKAIATLVVVCTAVSSASAVPAARIAQACAGVSFWANWSGWATGHTLGSLTIMPLAKLFIGGDLTSWLRKARRRERAEAVGIVVATIGVSVLAFAQTRLPLLPLLFLPFLPIMIAVFRMGRLGAALGLLVLAVVGSAFALHGTGPVNLIRGGTGERAQFFQSYLATAILMILPAAAELRRRNGLYSRLEENAALYQVIADRTGDILMALEVDGTVRFVSSAIRKIGGYDPLAPIGRKAQEIVLAPDVEDITATHRQALARPDETFMRECRARRASGEIGWFETHTRATVDAAGTVTGVVSVIREVSGRRSPPERLGRRGRLADLRDRTARLPGPAARPIEQQAWGVWRGVNGSSRGRTD